MRKTFAIVGLLMLTGCATAPGRFSLLDLDGRNEKQILADQQQAAAQWSGQNVLPPRGVVEEKSMVMTILSNLGSIVNWRIRLLSFEWGKK